MRASRIVIAAWALGPTAAAAQPAPEQPQPEQPAPPPAEKPPAVVAFEEGRALMEAHQPAQACAKFEQSIRLDPDAAGTMLNLGLCNEELDRTATSLRWFRKALTRSTETNLDAAYVEAARAKSVELARKVPILTVTAPKALDGDARRRAGRRVRSVAHRGRSRRAHARDDAARREAGDAGGDRPRRRPPQHRAEAAAGARARRSRRTATQARVPDRCGRARAVGGRRRPARVGEGPLARGRSSR